MTNETGSEANKTAFQQVIQQSPENSYLENVLYRVESLEKLRRFVVASVEAAGIAVNHCWEDEVSSRSIAANASKYVWNANELLHFAIVLGLDLLHRWSELDSLPTTNEHTSASDKQDAGFVPR